MTDSTVLQRLASQLPPEIRQMIYSQLDFGVAINLSEASRFFFQEVQPHLCTPASKQAFLSRAERYRCHATKPPFSHFHTSYACHDCHRVLPRDAFTDTSLAEDGVIGACRVSSDFNESLVQGPLLAGSRWSRTRASAKSYMLHNDLRIWSPRNRRSCFECEIKRGGWWPGQSVSYRGHIHLYCVQCQRLRTGPHCLGCHACESCRLSSPTSDTACTAPRPSHYDPNFAHLATPKACLHVYTVHHRPPEPLNARTLEMTRRNLVHLLAAERAGDPGLLLDLVFDPALDRMPPRPAPGTDLASMRAIGDSITALGTEPEPGRTLPLAKGCRETFERGSLRRWSISS